MRLCQSILEQGTFSGATVDTRSPLSVSLSSSFIQAARGNQLWADQRRDPTVKGKSPFSIEEPIVLSVARNQISIETP